MSPPVGRREFFTLEAGEYLERLALLASAVEPPLPEDLVRYARALRGAALMAGPPGYALAAGAIESLAKGVRDGSVEWSPLLADRLTDAVEDCKSLLRNVREWTETDTQRCERIAERLESEPGSGGARRPSTGMAAGGLTAGVRAYVAREAAAVAAALDQVADSVESRPTRDSADHLVQRLQPLRGLGSLPGLSPLPELLETLDLAVASSSRAGAWSPLAGKALRATGSALARMARDIAELGIPQHDSTEVMQAAECLSEAFLREDDVVDITSLFADRDPAPVVARGASPGPAASPTDLGIELVSLGDRLRQAAEQSRSHFPRSARALHLQGLVLTLRGLVPSPALGTEAREFLAATDREVLSGRALAEPEAFARVLRHAADLLADAVQLGTTAGLADALAPLLAELDRGAAPPDRESLPEIIPIEALAPIEAAPADNEADVVPIESLFYEAPAPAVTGLNPFEQTFSTYFRLIREEAAGTAPIVPIAQLMPDAEVALVPIQALLYRGRRALERADLVRRELAAARRTRSDQASADALLGELLDLVPLALDDER